tara:strand:- start:668 stop:1483 length:816 start_codon:yes stop_codon:yes gene_type:complete
MKYIVSFTTSPTRIHKCDLMLKSIINQSRKPDLILLNIPKIFARTGKEYNIPKSVSKIVTINIVEKDYGPGTKIIPTIKYLKNNNYNVNDTRIIYLDDDIRYLKDMILSYENIIEQNDNTVWCGSGFNFIDMKIIPVRKHNSPLTIVEGYGSVCVKLSIFEEDFYPYINKYIDDLDLRLSDDVILSNYYHKKNITKKIINIPEKFSVNKMWQNNCILEYGNETDALHNGADGISENNVTRYKKVIFKLNKEKERYFKLYFIDKNTKKITEK